MKTIKIENWQQYGEYKMFANLVDKTGKWIMLQVSGNVITGIGKPDGIEAFEKLLKGLGINYKIEN